ncbi:hypothetical protein BB934_45425 (plasmid) [Microvirga ossetica]|uniref:Uncharacterized protein n=1 Tax=Microvirga ossetica TaxID=1882682 RepID=A0A1B2EZV9_9HYPH|nr:hypothetical protein [Microvirga ossetica]ANY85463.1 hypothetical protein BB934_45425 [Microvirga ossetica]
MTNIDTINIRDFEDPALRRAYDEASDALAAATENLEAAREEGRKALRSVRSERRRAAFEAYCAASVAHDRALVAFRAAEDALQQETGRRIGEALAA